MSHQFLKNVMLCATKNLKFPPSAFPFPILGKNRA